MSTKPTKAKATRSAQVRDALGLSVVQMAAILGVTRQSVYAWERGDVETPGAVETLLVLMLRDEPRGVREKIIGKKGT